MVATILGMNIKQFEKPIGIVEELKSYCAIDFKASVFCIFAYCFTVIGLTELSLQWPIRIRHAVVCMADLRRRREKIFIAQRALWEVMPATPKKTKDRHSENWQLQILWSKLYFWRMKSVVWKIFAIGQRRKCWADFSWVLRLDWVSTNERRKPFRAGL